MKKTVAQVAKERGVTERAVYKQIKTHEKELEGHIEKREGKQWLDEYAVEVLQEASGNSAPVVVETVKERELEELRAEIKELKAELDADRVAMRQMTAANAKLLDSFNENTMLVAESKLYIEQRDNLREKLEQEQAKSAALEAELAKFRKTWFGWRKKD